MRTLTPLALAPLLLAACTPAQDAPTAPVAREASASAAQGREIFVASCAPCHASGDGGDLAIFAFPDSTIVRRALAHVTRAEAEDIVAHVRTLPPGALDRRTRPFQPAGQVLADDRAFALSLFGADRWPELDTPGLLAIDPRRVSLALAFPRWSVEEDATDWMPDEPLGDALLSFHGAQDALAAHHRLRSDETLLATVRILERATRAHETGAPCGLVDEVPADPERCFEAQRWIASLGAQHMLRTGREQGLHRVVHDAFWQVGQTVRRSLRGSVALENADLNWATWMMLGWVFEPGEHASVYTGNGLLRLRLPRHATFVALRSMVSRPEGSPHPYQDVRNAARFAPPHWAGAATATGLRHLEERLLSGETPDPRGPMTVEDLRLDVREAVRVALRKDPGAADDLVPLAGRVLALLKG